MPHVTGADLLRMRDQLFYEGPEHGHRLTKYWSLLVLAAIIATAGVVTDSTATVIGAMIVAPLMTPILGCVLSSCCPTGRTCAAYVVVLAVAASSSRSAWSMGHLLPVGLRDDQPGVPARQPTLIDLLAALATGAVGAVALAREDISDALPGVAIAISLVPPLAVVGLTLEAGCRTRPPARSSSSSPT